MSRQRASTGGVLERKTKDGTSYGIRFRAYGKRRQYMLGTSAEGITREVAERELAYVVEQVNRGEWLPPESVPVPVESTTPTFEQFAGEWMDGVKVESDQDTIDNYKWAVEKYLLPFFGRMRLDAITPRDVDRYRRTLIADREASGTGLSNNSINKTIFRLRQILDEAVEADHVIANVAAGKKRLAKATQPDRSWLDSAEKIVALLDATDQLKRKAAPGRDRAMVATLVFAGLRISELLDLRWCDVDLSAARLTVRGTKTDAAARTVNILPVLLDELKSYAHGHRPDDGSRSIARVFGTSGAKGRDNPSNVRRRVLAPAVEIANADLASRDLAVIERVTPHTLRRTFASLLAALNEPMPYTAGQLGHTDPKFTMTVYARLMKDRGVDRERIQALVDGSYRALTGAKPEIDGSATEVGAAGLAA